MDCKEASVTFLVTDGAQTLERANIGFDGSLYRTRKDGMMVFTNFPTREEYIYQISKEEYQTVSDTLFLERDTSLVVELQVQTHKPESSGATSLEVYPNPSKDKVYIHLNPVTFFDRIEVIDTLGKVQRSGTIGSIPIIIDVSGLDEGLYLIKITGTAHSLLEQLVIM